MKKIFSIIFLTIYYLSGFAQIANFTQDTLEGCGQQVIHFTNTSTNATSYFWNFGDGNTSTSSSAVVTENYVNPGTYTVSLIAYNGGNSDTLSRIIHIWKKPVAGFEGVNPLIGCIPLTVQFNDTSTFTDGNIVSWSWDFGDGFGSNTQNPQHTFNVAGAWNVFLMVTDIHGCNNSIIYSEYVKVSEKPVVSISADATHSCTAPFTVNFTNNSTGVQPLTYNWNFGDNTSSTEQNPVHTFNAEGTYSITVTVTDTFGCSTVLVYTNYISITPVVANFHFIPDSVCPNQDVNFFNDAGTTCIWNFGDGNQSTISNPIHQYSNSGSYIVTFVAAPGQLCQQISTDTIFVRPLPIAGYTTSRHYVCSDNMPVVYTDTTNNSLISHWVITSTDTAYTINENPTTVNFTYEGTYYTTLTVTDIYGCTSLPYTDSLPVIVDFPNAVFGINGLTNHCIPYDVNFTDMSSCNPIDNISGWSWDFGDGNSSNIQNPIHTYTSPGSYTITLTVTTDSGCTATESQILKVGTHQNPGILYSYLGGCANDDSIQFFSNSTDTALIDYWYWNFLADFGTDSTYSVATSSSEDPIVNFNGIDSVTILYVIGYLDCKDTLIDTNAFYLNGPFANIQNVIFNCDSPLYVGFAYSYIKQANRWYWDFDNDTTYDDSTIFATPTYVYNDTVWFNYGSRGNYTAKLFTFNDSTGCTFEDSISFRLYDLDAVITNLSPKCYNNSYFNISNSKDWDTPFIPFANYSINFSDGFTYVDTIFHDSINHVFPHVNGTYTAILTMQDIHGCIQHDTSTITIYYPVAGYAMDIDSGCAPLNIVFNDTSNSLIPYTLTWYSNLMGSPTFTTPNYTYNSVGTFNPFIQLVDSIGCTSTFSRPVYVLNIPANFSATDSTLCLGDSTNFTSSGLFVTQCKWDFGDGTNIIGTNPSHLFLNNGNYNVTLITQNSLPGCADTVVKPAFVQVQDITAIFNVSDSVSTCYPFSINISNLTNNQYSPLWNWSFGDGSSGTQFEPIHNYTMPGNYWLTMLATTTPANLFGCTSKDSTLISVGGPYANISYSDTSICKGQTVTFTLDSAVGVTSFTWSFGDGGSGTTSPFTYQFNYMPPNGLAKVYLIYQSDNNCQKKDSVYINIYKVLADFNYLNSITGNHDTAVCQSGSLNFYNYSLGADSMFWNLGNGSYFSSIDSSIVPSTQTYTNTTNSDITYNIVLTVYNTIVGCIDSISKQFLVYPIPQVDAGSNVAICKGSTVLLNAMGGNVISWSPPNGLSNYGSYNPFAFPDSSTMYYATVFDSHNCSNNDSVFVYVQQVPQLWHNPDTTIIIGEIVNMQANSDQSSISYNWTPSYGLSCTDCPNPIAQPLTTTTYNVEIVDSLNCFHINSQVTIEVKEEYSIDVPSAFTPNGDNNNDLIYVRGWGIKNLVEFKIFNRWGECVFTTDDINKGWDGTFKGLKQNIDTYAYTAKAMTYSGKILTKNGLFNLLK